LSSISSLASSVWSGLWYFALISFPVCLAIASSLAHLCCLDLGFDLLLLLPRVIVWLLGLECSVVSGVVSRCFRRFHETWIPAWDPLRGALRHAVHHGQQWFREFWLLARLHPRCLLRCAGTTFCVALISSPAFWCLFGPSTALVQSPPLAPFTCGFSAPVVV
jgi:hypothetical protein